MMKYYLAYGSNLNLDDMKVRCKHAKIVGTSYLKGYKLEYRGTSDNYAYLTLKKTNDESCIPVAIFKITLLDEYKLDKYEGYPNLYYKENIEIELNGKKKKAFIYLMHDRFLNHEPSDEYLNCCIKGYNDFNFDSNLLLEPIKQKTKKL